jgi:uncharacterized membrane protein YheB (UPF0754 family)
MNKGTVSNLISATLLVVGLILGYAGVDGAAQTLLLSVGMFAFSGGITNSIAVKMLFDRVPGLYGSGVIQTRFTEIREEIKKLILGQFFTEALLRDFVRSNATQIDLAKYFRSPDGRNPIRAFIDKQWSELTSEESLQPILSEQVDKILNSSMGGMLGLMGKDTILGIVTKFVTSFIDSMKTRIERMADEMSLDPASLGVQLDEDLVIAEIQGQVETLLARRLEDLSPKQVKRIVEDMIRNHLGWLVVWGNVFGGLMGLAAPFVSGTI